ncbi:nodulation protein NfeD [uncultured Metabacillus sp.]|uniref:NfeD family protein n=1 Tax=uncultured Metabacillus sp. TaxID=2860135 RepID=UPI002629E45A|nr:nodulation protein NfeD [uncultured Metabacillus sp.]
MKMRFFQLMIAFAFILALLTGFSQELRADSHQKVYVIPLEETVEKGLAQYIKRTISEANAQEVDHIILEINTLGGAVDGAMEIADTLRSSEIPITAYINRRAISAGAYIALNADKIYMAPGSQMGSAAIITGDGNAADDKAQSLWLSELKEAAERNGRDPKYALAMADKEVDISEYGAGKGDLLTLESKSALEVGYSEGTAKDRQDLLNQLNLSNAEIIKAKESFAEKVARFITHPVVVPILLSIGSLGLVVELYSPGFGLAGFAGLTSLFLFFYGHLVAGLAGMESVILFLLGIIFLIAELFVPGAILGVLGIGSIIASLYIASGNVVNMTISLGIALAVSITASILLVKVFGKRMNLFKKLILRDSTNTESGYVSNKSRTDLLGLEGVAMTTLRPSGTAVIAEERIDVVTEGSYIAKGQRVKVVKVEGSRIVVRELN